MKKETASGTLKNGSMEIGQAPIFRAYRSYSRPLFRFEFIDDDGNEANPLKLFPEISWPDGYRVLPRGPWRFRDNMERPRISIKHRKTTQLDEIVEVHPYWIVSSRFKKLLEKDAARCCEFHGCDTVYASGEPAPEYWICTVVRVFLGVIDESKSKYLAVRKVLSDPLSYDYSFTGFEKLAFKPQVMDSPLFRIVESPEFVFCS